MRHPASTFSVGRREVKRHALALDSAPDGSESPHCCGHTTGTMPVPKEHRLGMKENSSVLFPNPRGGKRKQHQGTSRHVHLMWVHFQYGKRKRFTTPLSS